VSVQGGIIRTVLEHLNTSHAPERPVPPEAPAVCARAQARRHSCGAGAESPGQGFRAMDYTSATNSGFSRAGFGGTNQPSCFGGPL
jgi:hypothetical protein